MKHHLLRVFAITVYLFCTTYAGAQDAPPPTVSRFAIVIGKNEPEQTSRATLQYADDDAFLMHQLLEEAGVTSTLLVSPDADTKALHQLYRTTRPTPKALGAAFDRVSTQILAERKRGKRTEFFLFYSGHGDVDEGEGFVVLEGGRLTRTMLLNELIARSPAHTNHVIIDACKSYMMAFNKGPGGTRRPFYREFDVADSSKNLSRTGFVLSASSAQDSHEWERFQAGIFSYEVRSALRGGADANQDGHITYGELGAFITTANAGIVNPRFRPQFLVRPPGQNADYAEPLLGWTGKHSRIEVDTQSAGHYYIETTNGVRVADVHPAGDQALTVYLPMSRPLFVRNANETTEGILYTEQPVVLSSLAMLPAQITRKGALNLAFESIFHAPFNRAAVRTYESMERSLVLEAQAPADRPRKQNSHMSKPMRNSLLGGTIAALVAGGTFNMVAFSRLKKAEESSQRKIPQLNQSIDRLNTAAVVCYSVALAAGISWLTITLFDMHHKKQQRLSLSPTLNAAAGMTGMIFIRTF